MEITLAYLGLWILFLVLALFGGWVYFYAKWGVRGPIIKAKWNNFKNFMTGKSDKTVKAKGKVVVEDQSLIKKLEEQKKSATTSQDILSIQVKEDSIHQDKKNLEKEISEKYSAKGAKQAKLFDMFKFKSKKSKPDKVETTKTDSKSLLNLDIDKEHKPNDSQDLLRENKEEDK